MSNTREKPYTLTELHLLRKLQERNEGHLMPEDKTLYPVRELSEDEVAGPAVYMEERV